MKISKIKINPVQLERLIIDQVRFKLLSLIELHNVPFQVKKDLLYYLTEIESTALELEKQLAKTYDS